LRIHSHPPFDGSFRKSGNGTLREIETPQRFGADLLLVKRQKQVILKARRGFSELSAERDPAEKMDRKLA